MSYWCPGTELNRRPRDFQSSPQRAGRFAPGVGGGGGGAVPVEVGGAPAGALGEVAAQGVVGEYLAQAVAPEVGAVGWRVEGGVAGYLAEDRQVREHQRRAGRESLDGGHAEALVERRQRHHGGAAVERGELDGRDVAQVA